MTYRTDQEPVVKRRGWWAWWAWLARRWCRWFGHNTPGFETWVVRERGHHRIECRRCGHVKEAIVERDKYPPYLRPMRGGFAEAFLSDEEADASGRRAKHPEYEELQLSLPEGERDWPYRPRTEHEINMRWSDGGTAYPAECKDPACVCHKIVPGSFGLRSPHDRRSVHQILTGCPDPNCDGGR